MTTVARNSRELTRKPRRIRTHRNCGRVLTVAHFAEVRIDTAEVVENAVPAAGYIQREH